MNLKLCKNRSVAQKSVMLKRLEKIKHWLARSDCRNEKKKIHTILLYKSNQATMVYWLDAIYARMPLLIILFIFTSLTTVGIINFGIYALSLT